MILRILALVGFCPLFWACGEEGPNEPCDPLDVPMLWVAEGESLSVQLDCGTGAPIHGREVSFEGLPRGAFYDSISGRLTWTPNLDQAAVYDVGVNLPATLEGISIRIGVADAHANRDNQPLLDPSRYPEEYGLPVLALNSVPADAVYTKADIWYRGQHYAVEAKLRGSSSRSYPKRNYTLKFDKDQLFMAPDLGAGFVDRKKVVLTSTFDDNSYVRSRLSFELWNRMDAEHLQIHTGYVVVYFDGYYHGLYTLSDHVDRHLMKAHGMLDTGNLYKQSTYAADFRFGEEPTNFGVEKAEGKPEGDFSDFNALIEFIDTTSDAEFFEHLPERLNLKDYRDWWVLVTIIRAEDSANKNSYHYLEAPGVPSRYAPWDFNSSFGQTWKTERMAANELRTYTDYNRLFERLLGNPEQAAILHERRQAMLDTVFHPDAVEALIDQFVEEATPAAQTDWAIWEAVHRDFFRWRDRQDFTSMAEELSYVKDWYRQRWAALKADTGAALDALPDTEPVAPDSGSLSPGTSPTLPPPPSAEMP